MKAIDRTSKAEVKAVLDFLSAILQINRERSKFKSRHQQKKQQTETRRSNWMGKRGREKRGRERGGREREEGKKAERVMVQQIKI